MNLRIWFLAFLFLMPLSVSAQSCPHYWPADKDEVKTVMIETNSVLARMREIAYLGGISEPVVQLGLNTHRAALESEYQALIGYIDYLAQNPGAPLAQRSLNFLDSIVDANSLGVAGTTVQGATQNQAEQNSLSAHIKCSGALTKLWNCF